MPWLIFALGLGLGAGGGWSIVHGYPYMQIEFGWTEVIAGSTALAGGVVTMALAAVLRSLKALRSVVERTGLVDVLPWNEAPKAPPSEEPKSAAPLPLAPKAHVATRATPGGPAPAEVANPRRPPSSVPPREPNPENDDAKPRAPVTAPISNEGPRPTTVLGRYQSSGSSYSLFTDGTIEVESEAGKRRFGSMGELKTFLAKEEAPASRAEATP